MGGTLGGGLGNFLEPLTEIECQELLRANSIARVGLSIGAIPAIYPVGYLMEGDVIHFLTGVGSPLNGAVLNAVVAFQVDDGDRHTWSVLAVGVANEVEEPASELRVRLALQPWTPSSGPLRLVRMQPQSVSGFRINLGNRFS